MSNGGGPYHGHGSKRHGAPKPKREKVAQPKVERQSMPGSVPAEKDKPASQTDAARA